MTNYICSECGAPALVQGFNASDSTGVLATVYGWQHADASEAADCGNVHGDREAFALKAADGAEMGRVTL